LLDFVHVTAQFQKKNNTKKNLYLQHHQKNHKIRHHPPQQEDLKILITRPILLAFPGRDKADTIENLNDQFYNSQDFTGSLHAPSSIAFNPPSPIGSALRRKSFEEPLQSD
jgi:hypothetical protein